VVRGRLSAIITLTDEDAAVSDGRRVGGQLIVACRGPIEQRAQVFFLQVLISHLTATQRAVTSASLALVKLLLVMGDVRFV